MSVLRRRSAHVAVILAIGALAVTGCGKSSSGGSTVTPGNGAASTPASSPTSSSTPTSTASSGGGYGY